MGEIIDGQPLFPGESEIDQLYCIQKVLGPLIPEHKEAFLKNPHFLGFRFPEILKFDTLEKKYLGKISKTGLSFMKGLLCMNPKERMTASQALNHSYFDELKEDTLRPQTSSELRNSYQNKLSILSNKKPVSIASNYINPLLKTDCLDIRAKTRSSMFVSETNELESQKGKDFIKNFEEPKKVMMFHISEETDSKKKLKNLKKKIKVSETKLKYQKKGTSENIDCETASGNGSNKQLPHIHHYNYEYSTKKIEIKGKNDGPDLCGGPEEKYFTRNYKAKF